MNKQELKAGHRYLITECYQVIIEVECVEVSKTSYKLRYPNGNCIWKDKDRFNIEYNIKEELGSTLDLISLLNPQQ